MKRTILALKPVLAALVLGACSTNPLLPENAWKIAPVQKVRHGGSNAAGHFALGRYREGQGAYEQAIAAYRKALDTDPKYAPAWNALGTLQAQLGQVDDGLAALERAVQLQPSASHLHNNLGYALLLAGRAEHAVGPLRRAVELDAGNRRAWRNLAEASRQIGALDDAALADARAGGPATMASREAASLRAGDARPAAAAPSAGAGQAERVVTPAAAARSNSVTASPAPAPAETVMGPSPAAAAAARRDETPRVEIVKIAENVFELRNGAPTRADDVAAAAAIVTATTHPSTAAATVPPVPSLMPEAIVAAPLPAVAHLASSPAAAAPAASAAPASAALPAAARPSRPARYEIANGHGGEGLARRLAGLLSAQGFARPRLTNHLPYNQPTSFVAYRDGYRADAEAFAARLPFRPQVLPGPSAGLAVDVRLLLGRDLTASPACAVLGLCRDAGTPPSPPRPAPGITVSL